MSLKSHLQCGQQMGARVGFTAKGQSSLKVKLYGSHAKMQFCWPGIIFFVMFMKLREKIAIEAFGRYINNAQ